MRWPLLGLFLLPVAAHAADAPAPWSYTPLFKTLTDQALSCDNAVAHLGQERDALMKQVADLQAQVKALTPEAEKK